MKKLSYSDVIVVVDGVRYSIFGNYFIQLTCSKAAGWSLWRVQDGTNFIPIGNEFDSDEFRIEVAGKVMCGKPIKKVKNEKNTKS